VIAVFHMPVKLTVNIMHHKQLPIHFYHVIVATLGQISPETATLFQLVICGFVSFYRILPICRNSTQSNPNGRRRKQRSVTFHACQYRPRHWQHFYRSTWPIRLRLQNDVAFIVQSGFALQRSSAFVRRCQLQRCVNV
jgi:hypothetical protein